MTVKSLALSSASHMVLNRVLLLPNLGHVLQWAAYFLGINLEPVRQ